MKPVRGVISSWCSSGTCVWVDMLPGGVVLIGDTKQAHLPDDAQVVLEIDGAEFESFQGDVVGQKDSGKLSRLVVTRRDSGFVELSDILSDQVLEFDQAEWDAFRLGVISGDFAEERFKQRVRIAAQL